MPKSPASPFTRYVKADAPVKQRLIGLSIGEPGSRKTSFWLEGPGPIVVQSLDQGLEGVVERYQTEKDIYVAEYDWSPKVTNEEDEVSTLWTMAKELADKFEADYEHAIQNARTVLWDKETDVWALFRYAEFGPEMNDAPRNYPKLNQRYRRLINLAKGTDVNFGCIEGMRDEWGKKINKNTGKEGAASTGNRIRAGFGELDGLVHLCLQHKGVSPETWSLQVGKARGPGGHEIAGQEFPYQMGGDVVMSFTEFALLVFPESSAGDWE